MRTESESCKEKKSPTSGVLLLAKKTDNKKLNTAVASSRNRRSSLATTIDQNKIIKTTTVKNSRLTDNASERHSIPSTFNMSARKGNVKERSDSLIDSSKNSERKRGRPRKSVASSAKEKLDQQVAQKKPNVLGNSKVSTSKAAKVAKHKTGDLDKNLDALTLAIEMGYSNPNVKITIKSSDKDEEITRQVTPIEIIQQAIDYKLSSKCTCLAELSIRDIAKHRHEITLLDRQARDFFIMGLLRCAAVTFKETSRHHDRIRNRFSYRMMNTKICHLCFLMVNNIGGKYLKNLKKHFATHGVTSRTHGNSGRKPSHAIGNSDIKQAIEFVSRYAEEHGTPAARPPKNRKSKRIIKLPVSENVTSVHKRYKEYYAQAGQRTIALTSFRKVWIRHLPHIKLAFKDSTSPTKPPISSDNMPEPQTSEKTSVYGHSTLKHILNTRRDAVSNNNAPQPMEVKTTAKSQTVSVSLPQDFSGSEINMYLNEGENQDGNGIQYSYHLFSPISGTGSQQLHTTTSTSGVLSSLVTSNSSSHLFQHPETSVTINPSVIHLSAGDAYHSSNLQTDRQYLLLSPGSNLDVNSSHFVTPQPTSKNSATIYTQRTDPTQHSENVAQQNMVVSGHITTSNTQIHMPLYK